MSILQKIKICKNITIYFVVWYFYILFYRKIPDNTRIGTYIQDLLLYYYFLYMRFFLRFIATALAIYFLMYFKYLPGITLTDGTNSLLIFTFILGLINLIIWGILRLITLPLRILSLWLVGFLISIIVVLITDEFVAGIELTEWKSIIIIALSMGVISMILS